MKKSTSILTSLLVAASIGGSALNVINAAIPPGTTLTDIEKIYAIDFSTEGNPKTISDAEVRKEPDNALGAPDVHTTSNKNKQNELMYSVGTYDSTTFTFGKPFYNVANQDKEADIVLSEVTWSDASKAEKWHVEACKVYLTNAYVRNADGEIVKYEAINDDEEKYGYYAGVAWNNVGHKLDDATKASVEQKGYEGKREFIKNYDDEVAGDKIDIQYTGINLPAEVVYAEAITLVDITSEVYNLGNDKLTLSDGYTDKTWSAKDGGYDLDSISVYSATPLISVKDGGGDSATGLGTRINKNGNWFMYNTCNLTDKDTQTFEIQAGNPKLNKDGEATKKNVIGTYTVTKVEDGKYIVDHKMNPTIEIDGYEYKIVVKDEHLGIKTNGEKFTAKPGQDDKYDFGETIEIKDDKFDIFAHFSVEYKAYIGDVDNPDAQ